MNISSKERVMKAINHMETDRVPMHMNATKWVLEKLERQLGVTGSRQIMEALHLDSYDMRGLDIHSGVMPAYVGPPHPLLNAGWNGDFLKIWGVEEKVMGGESGFSYAIEKYPLSGAADLNTIQSYPWPNPDWFDYTDLEKNLAPWSDYAIIASGGSLFQHATFLRGMDFLLMDMLGDPDMAHYFFDRFFEFYHGFFSRVFESAGNAIDIFALADDLATQRSLLVSPELFETYFASKIKAMADLAHQYDIKLLLHTCGNVVELIPRFIELGVDILDPIQPESEGMDPENLKAIYGNDLCFRGGISAQKILAYGSHQEVRDETRRIIDILAPGGGYILSPGHPVLQDDIPVRNIITMYETANNYQ